MKQKRWLKHPWLTGMLAVSWLLLQHSLEPVHLLSAALIGLVLPRLLHDFLPREASLRLLPMLSLTRVVLWDILISNITVARLVLGPLSRMRPAWVPVPLALTNPTAISLLATIITTTPGTVSCTIDEQRREILVHALNCDDPAQMASDIKNRYETPLLAIFEHASPQTGKGDST
ncbi:Na+/H+ antiporter subunit E [Rhodoferax sp.]|uniref:Na+/H+ antiporter subunit E n=1 Tax=Rhodoferax sp. TaxID=50421 RepID=UPI0027170E27|nr:Na+/H+ antiporter subunit E [Rhodoferax sp.]MDO9195823.1 Na+/H+ antiporter subunit E [Rhodoferax sp.]